MKQLPSSIFFGVLLVLAFFFSATAGDSAFKIANRFSLPGDGFWDLLKADADTGRLFLSHGTEVHEESKTEFKVLENVATQKGARTMALDSKTHHIYLPTAQFEPAKDPKERRPSIIPRTFMVLDVAPPK